MLKHKKSGEVIFEFPYYYNNNGIYGYLVLTYDKKILFFSVGYYEDYTSQDWDDLTEDYEIAE